jgi:hypothetical protein
MSAKDRTNWFWSDLRGDPAVRRLTPAERGLWIDLLSFAAAASPAGYVCDAQGRAIPVEEIARFANCSVEEASKLIIGILEKGVASRDRAGRLYNRRSVRETELSAKRRAAGTAGGAATKATWNALTNCYEMTKKFEPGQMPRQTSPPLSNTILRNLSSQNQDAARDAAVQQSPSALAEPQQAVRKENGAKPPHQTSRAELDEIHERRKTS